MLNLMRVAPVLILIYAHIEKFVQMFRRIQGKTFGHTISKLITYDIPYRAKKCRLCRLKNVDRLRDEVITKTDYRTIRVTAFLN